MTEITKNVFTRTKPCSFLINLLDDHTKETKTTAWLGKKADSTFAHTKKTINKCIDNGLVDFEKQGRRKRLYLTEKGNVVANKLKEIFDILRESKG